MLTMREIIRTFYNALLQKLKNHRGNWNQNDPTADDYIKNRPFYTDDSKNTVIIRNTNVTIDMAQNGAAAEGGFATITYSPVIEMIVGKSYVVTWDERDYECTAYEVDGITAVGNSSLMMYRESASTGEPFFIAVSKNYFNGAYICANEIGTHTVQVIQYGKVVLIDKKYLPGDMIDQDKLESQLNYVYNDISNVQDAAYGSVKYNTSQSLTDTQKTIARNNIGAMAMNNLAMVANSGDYNDLENKPCSEISTYSDWITLKYLNSGVTTQSGNTFDRWASNNDIYSKTNKRAWKISKGNAVYLKTDYSLGRTFSNSKDLFWGNASLYDPTYDNTGEDWCLCLTEYHNTYKRNEVACYIQNIKLVNSDAILQTSEVESTILTQLDEKFIPDTIARVTDIPDIPVTSVAHQQLVTDANGKTMWEERTHWKEESVKTLVDNITLDSIENSDFTNPFELELKTGNAYTVVLDGVTYDCVAAEKTMYGETIVFIGNKGVVGEENGTEPFAIFCFMGMVSVTFMESAVHTISITEKAVEYHALDPNYLPPIKVEHPRYSYDLEANDPKSLNYVKGRTHYVEYNLETLLEETTLVSERDTYNTNSKYVIPLTEVIDFPDPIIKYVVKYDGQEYCSEASPAFTNGEQYWGVGNPRRLTNHEQWEDSGEPFFIGTHTERGTFVFTNDTEPTEHQISIAVETGRTFHQLDREFIPGPLVINVVSDLTDWDGISDIEVDIDKTYGQIEGNYKRGIDLIARLTIPLMDTTSSVYSTENRRELILHHDATLISKSTHIQTGTVYGDEENFLFAGICKNVASARVAAEQEISDGSVLLYTLSVLYGREKATLHVNRLPAPTGDDLVLNSSTEGSTKKFKLTIDDSGVLTATEIVE